MLYFKFYHLLIADISDVLKVFDIESEVLLIFPSPEIIPIISFVHSLGVLEFFMLAVYNRNTVQTAAKSNDNFKRK